MRDSSAETKAETIALTWVSICLCVLVLFILVVSVSHSYHRFEKLRKEDTYVNAKDCCSTRVTLLLLTPLTVACFSIFNITLVIVYSSVWAFGRCKFKFNAVSLRIGFPSYGLGKYCMYCCTYISSPYLFSSYVYITVCINMNVCVFC